MINKLDSAKLLANTITPITGIECPRYVINPGLYFGFIKGWEARDEEIEILKEKIVILEERNNQYYSEIEELENIIEDYENI